jgi:hypothetical protein
MNILVIDSDLDIINAFNYLKHIEPTWNIRVFDESLDIYNNNIDFVAVDFSKQSNKNTLTDILKINQNQKTITISESLTCSDIHGCEHCAKNFNRRRMLKPIEIKSLYHTIKYFDIEQCKYSLTNSFQDIEVILPEILNRFLSYKYDKTRRIMRPINSNSIYSTRDMVGIVDILKTHNIQFHIINDEDIKIY